MRLLIVCDPPVDQPGQNVGGTHAVISHLRHELTKLGHEIEVISADTFANVRADQTAYDYVSELLDGKRYDSVHIATQGLLGLLSLRYFRARGIRFTTAFHTQYPEWLATRHGVPEWLGYAYMRWFCNRAEFTIVPTPGMAERLKARGIKNTVSCLHGVDTERFKPATQKKWTLPRPIALYVGRIMPEKSPEDLAALPFEGTKVMVGDGNLRPELEAKYPDVKFLGQKTGQDLADCYAEADVFVFPSRTDTFGLVMLEALAAGVPVAAYPVTGPVDVITDPKVGCLHEDLGAAVAAALKCSPADCRAFAEANSWAESAKRFLSFQVPARLPSPQCAACSGVESARLDMQNITRSACPTAGINSMYTRLERRFNVWQFVLEMAVRKGEQLLFGQEPGPQLEKMRSV